MKIPFVDLKLQSDRIREQLDKVIKETIDNSNFVGGHQVSSFESSFAQFLGVKHCVSCANGTDSMEIILKAMNIGVGDEVIVPALSWISTAEVVSNVGAEPVFVDIIEGEYTIDPALIESAISERTKAIIPVHLYGLPARMSDILDIANKYNLMVIEDCAQAHGAKIGGQFVGSFGHAASFSFYPGKNLGAFGDAGGIATNDDDLAKVCKQIGNHGQLKKHDHQLIGRNSRMDSIQAAILSVKLPYLSEWVEGRRSVASRYAEGLSNDFIFPKPSEKYYHAYHLYVIRTQNRDSIIRALDLNEIGYGIHYPKPLPFTKAYGYKKHNNDDFPIASKACEEIISLPMFPELTDGQIEKVITVLNNV